MQESERSGWTLSNQWRLFCRHLRQRRQYERKDLLRHDLYGFAALWNDACLRAGRRGLPNLCLRFAVRDRWLQQ
jgi:hypothetical protein